MTTLSFSTALLVAAAGVYAGAQNALAGGGSFITFPALLLAGLNPLAANMTSTIALFPSQITSSIAGRKLAGGVDAGAHHVSLKQLIIISLIGGVLGALLLLATPPSFFAKLVPYLVLFATTVFAWGSFRRKPLHATAGMSTTTLAAIQFAIAIYGGYFGGGIGFLMLAALTMAGLAARNAAATKNLLAGVINASAVALFVLSPEAHWREALVLGAGAVLGGMAGSWALHRINEKLLRVLVVCIGITLTIGLFLRG